MGWAARFPALFHRSSSLALTPAYQVAEGAANEIRLPITAGSIVGAVAQTGLTVNVPDAYNDSRFNRDVDRRSGYRTGSILCVALRGGGGSEREPVIGVLQLINKKPAAVAAAAAAAPAAGAGTMAADSLAQLQPTAPASLAGPAGSPALFGAPLAYAATVMARPLSAALPTLAFATFSAEDEALTVDFAQQVSPRPPRPPPRGVASPNPYLNARVP